MQILHVQEWFAGADIQALIHLLLADLHTDERLTRDDSHVQNGESRTEKTQLQNSSF